MKNEPELESDQDYDQLWDDNEYTDESLDSGEPAAAEPEPEPIPDPAPAPEADPQQTSDDVDKLRHKLKSAEGRFTKFEDHISELKSKLNDLESKQQPEPEPEPEPEQSLPEGWSKEDWNDFAEDNPAQAELLRSQNREVQQLKDKVEVSEHQRQEEDAARTFRSTVVSSHPDYDELLANKRDDIKAFIDNQANPVLKSAYQTIYQRGSAEQVVQLVTDYKGSRSASDNAKVDDRRVNDALAVPSRSASPSAAASSSGQPDKEDFDAAWDYFKDDAID